jgi:hypothetical protein
MAESSQHPLPPPGHPAVGGNERPGSATHLRALSVTLAIGAGGALLGIAGGFVWSAIAPRALFSVASHGIAYVVNPETSAFIAADGWYSVVAVIGGLLIGLAGYLLGVRRYGPLPAAGALVGATAAAFLAWWIGRNIGLAHFRHLLGTSKPGTLIRQPASLGAHGALAFWPLAAGAVIGGIELVLAMRERQGRADPQQPIPAPLPAESRGPEHYRTPDEYRESGHYGGLDSQDQNGRDQNGRDQNGRDPEGHSRDGQAEQRQAGRSSDQLDN